MKNFLAQKGPILAAVIALAICWALVILVALSVSQIVLETLDAIVELANLTE